MDNLNTRKGNWFIDQLNVYQAANSDFVSIKNNFLVRTDEFRMIIDAMKNKTGKDPVQHELILGRRGSGKSTLLKRIEIEIDEDKELRKKFVPINLAEEQAGIYRLFDLWEQVLNELFYRYKVSPGLKDYAEFDSDAGYARYLYSEIHKICTDMHVKAVILLDNFDRIVENLDDNGNLLREILTNYNDIQIIAGSTRMDEYFWAHDKPFYEYFRRHKLEALTREEIQLLLNHWANTLDIPELKNFVQNNPGKIENIRLLTDGLPRTLQFFIQMVLQKEGAGSYDYLKKIMDTVSPLYQERLNHLPPPQRKLVLELAFFWEATGTKQLAEKARMESKTVSAQLKQLEEKGIVDKIETGTKNHLYRVSERFFNLWLIVTQGSPEQKRKARWLSVYLENFYDENTLRQLCSRHLEELRSNGLKWESALMLSKALAQSKYIITKDRDELISLTEKLAGEKFEKNFLLLPKKFQEISSEIKKDIESKQFEVALAKANEIENEADGAKESLLGLIHFGNYKYDKAEHYFLESMKKGYPIPKNIIGMIYFLQKKLDLALPIFLNEINSDDSRFASLIIATIYEKKKEYDLSEKYYLLAIEGGDDIAIWSLAIMYEMTEKFELAEKYYLLAIERGDDIAIESLARMYEMTGMFELAEKYNLLAIEKGRKKALLSLAIVYEKTERFEFAEKTYLKAADAGQNIALLYLGLMYHQKNNVSQAEKYYKKGIRVGQEKSGLALFILYYENNIKKEKALELAKSKEVEILDRIVVEIWNGEFNNLEPRIIEEFKKKEFLGVGDFMEELIIHQQKSLVLKLFNNPEFGKILQEKYLVIYYSVLLMTKQGDKNLELKIPPELNEPIKDLMTQIHVKEIFYGYKKE